MNLEAEKMLQELHVIHTVAELPDLLDDEAPPSSFFWRQRFFWTCC